MRSKLLNSKLKSNTHVYCIHKSPIFFIGEYIISGYYNKIYYALLSNEENRYKNCTESLVDQDGNWSGKNIVKKKEVTNIFL